MGPGLPCCLHDDPLVAVHDPLPTGPKPELDREGADARGTGALHYSFYFCNGFVFPEEKGFSRTNPYKDKPRLATRVPPLFPATARPHLRVSSNQC
jgi:hypothetical protein